MLRLINALVSHQQSDHICHDKHYHTSRHVHVCCCTSPEMVRMQNWPQDTFPLRRVGKMVINQNIDNFHNESEQIAFNPGTVVPGEWQRYKPCG